METVHIKINGMSYERAAGSTILEAAHSVGIEIPTLCYLKGDQRHRRLPHLRGGGEGRPQPGHRVRIPRERGHGGGHQQRKGAWQSRKTNLELLLSTHDQNCLSCVRSTDCELQRLCRDYGVDEPALCGLRASATRMDDIRPAHDSRQQQVHPVPPLRGRLPREPGA